MGFLMQVEIETVNQIIYEAKKPVLTIKPMAAGRVSPFVGLNFVWNTIRPCDCVTVGCFDAEEAEEDVEISLAAIERRRPDIEKRASPNQNQDAFGKFQRAFAFEKISARLKEEEAQKFFGKVVDSVEDLHRRGTGNVKNIFFESHFKRGQFIFELKLHTPIEILSAETFQAESGDF
jgi:hypothetical protein